MSLFPSIFVPLPFSLCSKERTSYVLSCQMMVFFYLVTTGWIFCIISLLLCDNSINQGNRRSLVSDNEKEEIYYRSMAISLQIPVLVIYGVLIKMRFVQPERVQTAVY